MINFEFDFEYLNVQTERFTALLKAEVNRIMHEAAVAFLNAAAPRIPVRTGFAHGSLANLAHGLGVGLPPGAPGSTPRPKEYYYTGPKTRILKTPTAGQQFATPANLALTMDSDGTMKFKFDVDISYFYINDVIGTSRVPSSPWNAYREGFFAFYAKFNELLPTLNLDLKDFIQVTKANF